MTTQTQVLDQNQLVQIIKDSGLEKTKAQVLLDNFTSYFELAADWKRKADTLQVINVDQVAEMKMAREGRLFLQKKRTDVERTRKELKESALREGQTIDAIAKILTNLIIPIEKDLEAKEKFREIQEAKRKAELKALRESELQPYSEFVSFNFIDLGSMDETNYHTLLSGAKLSMQNKIEADQKAEAERLAKIKAEEEERKRIHAENERLKKEAEAKEKQLEIERAEAKKQLEIAQEKAKKEAEAKEKLQNELKAKKEADDLAAKLLKQKEEAELKAKQLAEKKAAAAPDKEKLIQFARTIQALELPVLKTEDANKILDNATELLFKVSTYLTTNANKL